VSELIEQLRRSFIDEEYRNSYAESFMNSYVAAQIKVLREAYPLTQEELSKRIGTKQPGVARLENVNYSSWKVETLRKLARAFNVRLKITFEEFGSLPDDIEAFNRTALLRAPFKRDPAFFPIPVPVLQHAVATGEHSIAETEQGRGTANIVSGEMFSEYLSENRGKANNALRMLSASGGR
jgi:transcriptional regulator with XRE-family HTH domain